MHMNSKLGFKAGCQVGTERCRAGAAIAQRGDVSIAYRHVGQRRQHCWNGRHGSGAIAFHQTPVVGNDLAVAKQRRGRHDYLGPSRKRSQCPWQHTRDVEQRVTIDDYIVGARAL